MLPLGVNTHAVMNWKGIYEPLVRSNEVMCAEERLESMEGVCHGVDVLNSFEEQVRWQLSGPRRSTCM